MIICISGLAGSGKTTAANIIIRNLKNKNYSVLHYTSDFIGESIFPNTFSKILSDPNFDYSSDELTTIYNVLFLLFKEQLDKDKNTIIVTDGMYRKKSQRLILRTIAEALNIPFILVKMETSEKNSKDRLIERSKQGKGGGWVNPNEYDNLIGEEHFSIQNNNSFELLEKQIIKLLGKLELVDFYFSKVYL